MTVFADWLDAACTAFAGDPASALGSLLGDGPGVVGDMSRRSRGPKTDFVVARIVRWRMTACATTVGLGCLWLLTSGWVSSIAAALGIVCAVFAWMMLSAKPDAVAIEWDGSAGDDDGSGSDPGDRGHGDGDSDG